MGQTTTICDECNHEFNPEHNPAGKTGALLAGAGVGAYAGSGTGIALGPFGAIAGTVPGAVIGGTAGAVLADRFVKCPECGEVQKL